MPLKFTKNPTEFKANPACDSVDWADLISADNSYIDSDFHRNIGKSKKGIGYRVERPLPCYRATQDQNGTWPGNFELKMALLHTLKKGELLPPESSVSPLKIVFDTPIHGAGAPIQQRFFKPPEGTPFNAIIEAFDSGGVPLKKADTLSGLSNDQAGTAIFIGLLNDSGEAANIKSIAFSTDVLNSDDLDNDFAIGTLLLIP